MMTSKAGIAVVCVEAQNGVLGPESVLPALAEDSRGLVENWRQLFDAARSAGILAVHSTYEGTLSGIHPGSARVRALGPATAGWAPRNAETQVISALLADSVLVPLRITGCSPPWIPNCFPCCGGSACTTIVLAGVSLNLALPVTAGHVTGRVRKSGARQRTLPGRIPGRQPRRRMASP